MYDHAHRFKVFFLKASLSMLRYPKRQRTRRITVLPSYRSTVFAEHLFISNSKETKHKSTLVNRNNKTQGAAAD